MRAESHPHANHVTESSTCRTRVRHSVRWLQSIDRYFHAPVRSRLSSDSAGLVAPPLTYLNVNFDIQRPEHFLSGMLFLLFGAACYAASLLQDWRDSYGLRDLQGSGASFQRNRLCQSPIECVFCAAGGIISGMHAEAVKLGARPSKFGLMSDAHRAMNCEECDARYCLHYDSDAEGSVTHWSLVAKEIIMAHHPHHTDIVVLDRLDKF